MGNPQALHRRPSVTEDSDAPLIERTQSQEIGIEDSVVVSEEMLDNPKTTSPSDVDESLDKTWPWSTTLLVLLCAFITSLSFGVTQVPLLYFFRLATCDAYYEHHPEESHYTTPSNFARSIASFNFGPVAHLDRCSIPAVESSTAISISILGASNTIFGIVNLFITSSLIKRIGVKSTLMIQVLFPAVRLFIQNVGVEIWGLTGLKIVQCSQIVSMIGGPSGYILSLNTFITEVVPHEGRTAALGRLQGSTMFGSAVGFLVGGILADSFGIKAPFRVTFLLFLSSVAYVMLFLPYIQPPEQKASRSIATATATASEGVFAKLARHIWSPLAVFRPQKFRRRDGSIQTEYGALLLAIGVFLGILATGYLVTILQLAATDVFGFGTSQNGGLIFLYSALRGVFLTFMFPPIIKFGRQYTSRISAATKDSQPTEQQPLLTASSNNSTTEANPPEDDKKQHVFTFDLTYTRYSLLADALLTMMCTFVKEGWEMYLMATILPFSAGTSSASKGTILQMIGHPASSTERTDALAGISLVENMARLSTTFIFGAVFAAFANIGRIELVFACNAGVALIAFAILLLARFPLEGSYPVAEEADSTDSSL